MPIKKKVFIAIPNCGTIIPELVLNLLQWTHDSKYDIRVFMPKNIFPSDAARNRCVKEFLESDSDYLLWIDDDVYCPPETIDRLVGADRDIIGAVCFAMKYERNECFPYPVTLRYNEERKYIAYYGRGIEEIDATGSACLMFKRKVYEAKELETPYQFHYHKDGTLSLTCDFDVLQKAQKAGFKIFIDFDLICSHVKEVDLKMLNNMLVRIKYG